MHTTSKIDIYSNRGVRRMQWVVAWREAPEEASQKGRLLNENPKMCKNLKGPEVEGWEKIEAL